MKPGAGQRFHNSWSRLQMRCSRRVTYNKFHAEDPHFWSDPWTLFLSVAFCSVHVNWYTFLYVRAGTAVSMLKMLSARIHLILIKVTNKMQLYRIIYYFIVPWLPYMFRAISLIIRSVLTVITVAEPRQQPTAIHVNETRSCNYS